MGVITAERLRGFMSSPRWTAPQVEAAELICEAVESSLEDALFGAFISPRPWAETAPVLTDGGLVDTTHPVYRVTRIAGRAVAQDAPLPTGWRLQDQRLYRLRQSTPDATATMTSGWPYTLGYQPAQPMYSSHVDIRYEAGWGTRGALVLALLRKAQALMDNRHSDTVTVRGLTAQSPLKLSPEDWSVAELQPLGRYRRLGSGGSSSSSTVMMPEPTGAPIPAPVLDLPLTIEQGTTRVIVVSDIRDRAGAVLDPTGWALRGVARTAGAAIVAEWSHEPTGTQGLAEVVDPVTAGLVRPTDPTPAAGERWILLHVTPAMSRAWWWNTAHLDVHMTEPTSPFREERIGDRQLVNDYTTVYP